MPSIHLGKQQKGCLTHIAMVGSLSTIEIMKHGFRRRVVQSLLDRDLIERARGSRWRLVERADWTELLRLPTMRERQEKWKAEWEAQ